MSTFRIDDRNRTTAQPEVSRATNDLERFEWTSWSQKNAICDSTRILDSSNHALGQLGFPSPKIGGHDRSDLPISKESELDRIPPARKPGEAPDGLDYRLNAWTGEIELTPERHGAVL